MPTPEPVLANVPFVDALAALKKRYKNRVTTERWDELLGEAHANAFTVAGATTESLVSDLGAAVKSTLESGGTITDFRKQFDDIVARHGWSYNGKRGWRTKVIFDTNARVSYAAGRWDQIEQAQKREAKRGRVLHLIYQTVGDDLVRPQHQAWNKIILPADHSFWQTHYPPNGWGCRCIVRTATERYLKARGLKPTKEGDLPQWRTEDRINKKTGEVYPDQIPGIDTGWNYNVGQSYLLGSAETFGTRIMRAAPEFRPTMLTQSDQFIKLLKPSFRSWATTAADDYARGVRRPIAFMKNEVLDILENTSGYPTPVNALITFTDHQLLHSLRTAKVKRGQAVLASDIEALAGHLRKPAAVLFDSQDDAVVYAFKLDDGQYAKAIISVNYNDGRGRSGNSIRTISKVGVSALRDDRYQILQGKL